jgi:hypothetical protein
MCWVSLGWQILSGLKEEALVLKYSDILIASVSPPGQEGLSLGTADRS